MLTMVYDEHAEGCKVLIAVFLMRFDAVHFINKTPGNKFRMVDVDNWSDWNVFRLKMEEVTA